MKKRYYPGIIAVVLVALVSVKLLANVLSQTEHGNTNVDSDSYVLPGPCTECHTTHDSQNDVSVATGGPNDALLLNTGNALCTGCHVDNGTGSVPKNPPRDDWGGKAVYDASAHGTASAKTNPDTQKDLPDCVSCHSPHGLDNGGSPYLKLCANKQEDICYACHDVSGPAARDILSKMGGTSSTSSAYSGATHYFNGRHDFTDADQSASACSLECVNCHNPHRNKSTFTASSSSKFIDPSTYGSVSGDTNYTTAYTTANYSGQGVYDPTFGATVPDYIEFCLVCHEPSATLPTGVVFSGSPDITEIDWSSSGDQHGGADGSGVGRGYLKSQLASDPGYVVGYTGNDYRNDANDYYPMICTDCHDPHGTSNNLFLIKSTINGKTGISWTDGTLLYGKVCYACHIGRGSHSSRINDTATCNRSSHAHDNGGF